MFKKKYIRSFLTRALAFGLFLFFLAPSVLKSLHSFEHHAVQKDCEHSTVHFHSSTLHNDVLDYYFHVSADVELDTYQLKCLSVYTEKTDAYRSSIYNSEFQYSSTRGPPYS